MDPRHSISVGGTELVNTNFSAKVASERASSMKLELAGAFSPLKSHSLVESVEVTTEPTAVITISDKVSDQDLIDQCATRGVHVVMPEAHQITIRLTSTFTRSDIFALANAINGALIAVGSKSDAPDASEKKNVQRLSPHERDLLANVPPHHGE